jgi:acryloyl-coenzyme A reductase
LSARVKQLTGGEGVDLVLEAVGTPTFEQGLRSLRWGGRIVVIGNVAPAESIPLALGSIILRENAILGCMNSTKADLTEALRLIGDGQLTPVTATVLPLEDAQHAHDLLRQRKSIGKIILRP